MPGLKAFYRSHPDIEVMVDATPEVLDLEAGHWDLALREGTGPYPGLSSELLFPLDLVPVSAPAYARHELRRTRTRWQKARLLHDGDDSRWRAWFEMADLGRVEPTQHLFFSNTAMAIEAAIDHQGVALVAPWLVRRELAGGTLTVVDARPLVTGAGVHAVWPKEGSRDSSNARTFRQWLLETASRDRQDA